MRGLRRARTRESPWHSKPRGRAESLFPVPRDTVITETMRSNLSDENDVPSQNQTDITIKTTTNFGISVGARLETDTRTTNDISDDADT